ncbi:MAG: DUF4403 family protein [Bacteroidetes bacterium]|nr:MAG: DUF4403 family protein [Bacteroidota bacterium]
MIRSSILSFVLISGLLVSCKSIQPTPPPIEVGIYQAPKQEKSSVRIPVEMDLATQFKEADRAVPYDFKGKQQQCEGVSYSYHFKRKPIQINGKGNKVAIDIDGKYALKLNYCAHCSDLLTSTMTCVTPRVYVSCGVDEPMRRIHVGYNTYVKLNNNYSLSSKTKLRTIDPTDRCEISVFRYDATGQLVKEVKGSLKDLAKEIDKQIESLDIRKEAELTWKSLAAPIDMGPYGYLNLAPEKLAIDNLRLKDTKLLFDLSVEAYPSVSLSPIKTTEKALPDLSDFKSGKGFNVNLDIKAQYDSLSSLINQNLAGQVIELKRQKIVIANAQIHGASDDQLAFEVDFTGSKSGKLFFVGTPVFNDTLQEISFPDLNFDLETKNVLLRSAKWLFSSVITNKMRELTKYNLKDLLATMSKELEKQLNGEIEPGVFLSGKMKGISVNKIFPAHDQLIIQSNLQGDLGVAIR